MNRRIATICLAILVIAGTALGASYALWHDAIQSSGSIKTGVVSFGVGKPGQPLTYAAASPQSVNYSVGPDEAAVLAANGTIAIPMKVGALSQGNRGLNYKVTPPTFDPDSYFGSSTVRVFKVANAAACKVANAPATQASGLESTPVPATYSGTSTPTTEFWCMTAVLGPLYGTGSYTNVATASGSSEGNPIEATGSWSTGTTSTLNPASEPTKDTVFAEKTFRPGETP